MSIKVSAHVWKHSKHRGSVKMLLLAMADFANDSGICWPSARVLAERINETERNTRQLLRRLVDDGDLLTVPGGGRGNTTHYAIAVGLTAKQRERIKGVLRNTVSANSEIKKTVKSGVENSDIPCQETVKSGDLPEGPFSAPESAETAQEQGGIRHVDPSWDPEIDLNSVTNQHSRQAPKAPPSDHQRLLQLYAEVLPDHRIPNGKQEGSAAKAILQAGYTPEQAIQVYDYLKSGFYADKHVSLQTVNKQIGAVLAAIKANTNGSHRNGTSTAIRSHTPPDFERAQWSAYTDDDGPV